VSHFLQFLDDGVYAAGADKENAIGEAADDFLGKLLARQQFLGQDGVFGLDEANAAVELYGNAPGAGWSCRINGHFAS
jgi:hypothetical protein